MGKDKSDKERKEKKEKKEKKRLAEDGVKKVKKDKKEKAEVTATLVHELEKQEERGELNGVTVKESAILVGALVPFANPLADESQTKTVLKGVKKGRFNLHLCISQHHLCFRLKQSAATTPLPPHRASKPKMLTQRSSAATKAKTLKRGVKEVVKALRKSPTTAPSSSAVSDPLGVVVLAADISPMDVISHIPVLCEDHNIPYIYVRSRAELGASSATKRPTSVVMLTKERDKARDKVPDEDRKDFEDSYKSLVKLVNKAAQSVKV
jgi:H/ACA ribonucleoprotein complex subunit 2